MKKNSETNQWMNTSYQETVIRILANEAVVENGFDTYFANQVAMQTVPANNLDLRNQQFVHFRMQCLRSYIQKNLASFPSYLKQALEQGAAQFLNSENSTDPIQFSLDQLRQFENQVIDAMIQVKQM